MKSKKVFSILSIILICLVAYFFLNPRKADENDAIISKTNVSEIISDKLNLVYIYTEWCGPCRATLKNLYGKDLKKDDLGLNIVIIGANHAKKDVFDQLMSEVGIELPTYTLENTDLLSLKGLNDHPRIENFIKSNFKNTELIHFNRVPISFYADENLNIISTAGQNFTDIEKQVKFIKDSLNI